MACTFSYSNELEVKIPKHVEVLLLHFGLDTQELV